MISTVYILLLNGELSCDLIMNFALIYNVLQWLEFVGVMSVGITMVLCDGAIGTVLNDTQEGVIIHSVWKKYIVNVKTRWARVSTLDHRSNKTLVYHSLSFLFTCVLIFYNIDRPSVKFSMSLN